MNNARGYSLLEVMISMVILAIAFLALIATQFGSLRGYTSARDELQASELGRRTSELLRLQGTQWIYNVDADADPGTLPTFDPDEPYDPGAGPTPFDRTNPVADIVSAPDWVALVDTPVDARFNRVNATISTDHLGGKYCIYARGAEMDSAFQSFSTGEDVVAAMRFQIAVVYPGPRGVLTDCTIGANFNIADLDDVGDPTASPFVPPPLETQGLRVSYFGTVIVRRAHLAQDGGSP